MGNMTDSGDIIARDERTDTIFVKTKTYQVEMKSIYKTNNDLK